MNLRNFIFIFIAGALILLAVDTVYTVHQTERAIVLQFGKVTRDDVAPGLHFKLPIAEEVKIFDARVLTLDLQQERYYTLEKKPLDVDSFVKWRVSDVEKFYTATSFDILVAQRILVERVNEGLRNQISRRDTLVLGAVAEPRGDGELVDGPLLHELHALDPALDETRKSELGGLAP